jgi:hypothetical protein
MDKLLQFIETITSWVIGGGMLLFALICIVMIFIKAFKRNDDY